jgi:hypothetical protein
MPGIGLFQLLLRDNKHIQLLEHIRGRLLLESHLYALFVLAVVELEVMEMAAAVAL